VKTAEYDVAVVGAGANGLVAAARLAQSGARVLLLERAPTSGGQGRPVEFAPGFTAAPWSRDAGWVPDRIARVLRLDGLERVASEAGVTVAVEPGAFLSIPRDVRRAAEAIAVHDHDDAAKWPAFTAQLRALAGFLEVLYQAPAPDVSATSLVELRALLETGRKFRALGRRNMIEFLRTLPLSVSELTDDAFACAALKAAIATGGIRDHQQGPRSGGTGFVLLHSLAGAPQGSLDGRPPWRAGPGAFTQSAERAARRAGVEMRTGAVAQVEVRDYAVAGVALESGETIPARAVLSTADPARTLLEWVDPVWIDPEILHAAQNIRHRGCTAFVFYALDALPSFPGIASTDALSGTVSLTPSLVALEKAADAAKYGAISERPHVELTVPTLLWPGLAPSNRHVMVARVQYAPYRLRPPGLWDAARRDALAERVTEAIAAVSPEFASRVLHRALWSPRDLEERYGLREGAATQGELGLDQILFMRPLAGWARHAAPIRGLYWGGAGTHPGPGILGGSGWLAAQRIVSDRKRG
jgi:phytoene dehydrogenase-like protein